MLSDIFESDHFWSLPPNSGCHGTTMISLLAKNKSSATNVLAMKRKTKKNHQKTKTNKNPNHDKTKALPHTPISCYPTQMLLWHQLYKAFEVPSLPLLSHLHTFIFWLRKDRQMPKTLQTFKKQHKIKCCNRDHWSSVRQNCLSSKPP